MVSESSTMASDEDFRELSTELLRHGTGRAPLPLDPGELDQQFDKLMHNSVRFTEVAPIPASWFEATRLLTHPNHPFTSRFGRAQASAYIRTTALDHPSAIDETKLDVLHAALFDAFSAVAEDVCVILGILRRPESREHLERFHALMRNEREWSFVIIRCEWALLRIDESSLVEPYPALDANAAVVDVKRLGPDSVQLVITPEGLSLRNPHSAIEVAVSRAEAETFRRSSASRIDEFFQSSGGLDADEPSRLGTVATGLMNGLPDHDMLSTLTDTTSLRMASATVNGLMSPEGLLDLSTIAYCCVMYDFVLIDAVEFEIPEELADVIVAVRPYEAQRVDPRWEIAVARHAELVSNPALQSEIDKRWTEALGRKIRVDFFSFDSITDSPGFADYTPGGTFGFYDPIDMGAQGSDAEASRDVSIQTFRYFINEKVAETLGVSYNCTSLRFPIDSLALANRSAYRQAADEFLDALLPASGAPLQSPRDSGPLGRLALPHPLSIVLAGAKSRDDIWHEIRKLRDRLAPVREAFRDGRRNGLLDIDTVESLLRDAFRESEWGQQIDSVIHAGAAIAAATPQSSAFAGVALKAGTVLKPASWLQRARQYILRPELRVVRSFHHDISLINGRRSDIERLWNAQPDREWLAAAAQLSAASSRFTSQLSQ